MSSATLQLFLCHSSTDKAAVRQLSKRLKNDGVDPWLDEENILPGQEWELEIKRAIRKSHVVLVCLSRSSITKEGFVQKEIKYALDAADEKPEDVIFLIPVRLEECKVPDRLRRLQWVDFFADDGYEKLLRALVERTKNIEPTPTLHISTATLPSTSPSTTAVEPRLFAKKPGPDLDMRSIFLDFWTWCSTEAAHGTIPSVLDHVQENWEYWTFQQLDGISQLHISQLGHIDEKSQQKFMDWLDKWQKRTYPNYPQVGRFILFKLSRSRPFEQWRLLDPFRSGEEVKGVPIILLMSHTGGSLKDIKRIESLLIPKEAASSYVNFVNFDAADFRPLEDARRAVLTVLRGAGLVRLTVMAMIADPASYSSIGWWWLWGTASLAGFVLLLLLDRAGSVLSLVLAGSLFLIILLPVLFTLFEFGRVARQSHRWAHLLENSQVHLLLGDLQGQTIRVVGSSIGLGVSLSILLALFESIPATPKQTRFWSRLFGRLKSNLSSWVFTGTVAADGRLVAAPRIADKIFAARQIGISNLIIPSRNALDAIELGATSQSELRIHRSPDLARTLLLSAFQGGTPPRGADKETLKGKDRDTLPNLD